MSSGTAYKLSPSLTGKMELRTLPGCIAPNTETYHTWGELQEIEHLRRDILQRVELPLWRVLMYWSGTCLRSLFLDWLIWLSMAIYCAIRIKAHTDEDAPAVAEQIGDTNLDILGGFLSFLLVLFVNQTNTRFFAMYQLAKKSAGQIQDVAGLASSHFPPAAAHRLVRYMNAAHVAGYVGLGGPYSKQYFFDQFNQRYNLLGANELARVETLNMDSGSAAFKELVTWCQKEVGRAKEKGYVDSHEAEKMHDHILSLRGSMDGIYDHCDQPTHFFYIHFLCLLSALYLPLFAVDNAYSAGWGADSDLTIELLNGTMVLVQSIFVVGLRLLGQKMIDPFGDDLEDLSVITYVYTTIDNCRIILEAPVLPDVDAAMEEELMNKRAETDELSDIARYSSF